MTQDERWKVQWQKVMVFMEAHKRRPSKYEDSTLYEKLVEAPTEAL